ncbi:class I SAM-dependent methyltransferase [Microbacterium tumbae]
MGEAYAASYAALCAGAGERLHELAGPAEGRSLLDVGSGEGTLAGSWADAGWLVTACEPEASMRAVSRRRHPPIPVLDGGLPHLPFPDEAFDAVVANFVLNHVSDPRASAAELARVSRGIVLATVWVQSPSWLWAEVVARAGLASAVGERLPAEKDFERTGEGFARMLVEAGLRDVAVTELTWTWAADPAALWASVEGRVAGAGAYYARLAARERVSYRAAFDEVVSERAEDGLLLLEHRAAIALSEGSGSTSPAD